MFEIKMPKAGQSMEDGTIVKWRKAEGQAVFEDRASGLRLSAPRLTQSLTSYYNAAGVRYPLLRTDGAAEGTQAGLRFSVETLDLYSVSLYFLKAPTSGNFHILQRRSAPDNPEGTFEVLGTFEGYSREGQLSAVTLKDILLDAGPNSLYLQAAGKDEKAAGQEIAFVGMSLSPSSRRFVLEWNLIGPFQAADMNDLQTVYPPEKETDFTKKYKGKNEAEVGWRTVQADATGYVRLDSLVQPNEQVLVYGLVYVLSPDDRRATFLLGSDDGIRVWVNDEVAHTNPSYRGAEPDQDRFSVNLKKGWNKVQIKVLQGAGGWGYYFRLSDPKGELRWNLRPEETKKSG